MSYPWGNIEYRAMTHYVGYDAYRHASARRELERVKLRHVKEFWGFDTPEDSVLLAHCPHNRMVAQPGVVNSLMNHYRAIKTGLGLGYTRLLIMEDDVRFLKDVNALEKIVEMMPDDFDLALLDWWPRGRTTDEELRRITDDQDGVWRRFTDLRSAACYALSARGAQAFVGMVERALRGDVDSMLRITDQYWPKMVEAGLNCYCAYPCAAVQGYDDGKSISNMAGMWSRYRRCGIERGYYAE